MRLDISMAFIRRYSPSLSADDAIFFANISCWHLFLDSLSSAASTDSECFC